LQQRPAGSAVCLAALSQSLSDRGLSAPSTRPDSMKNRLASIGRAARQIALELDAALAFDGIPRFMLASEQRSTPRSATPCTLGWSSRRNRRCSCRHGKQDSPRCVTGELYEPGSPGLVKADPP
jgi:hypothetical protein